MDDRIRKPRSAISLVALLCLAFFFLSSAWSRGEGQPAVGGVAAAAATSPAPQAVVTASSLNVRSGPGTTFPRVDLVRRGSRLAVHAEDGGCTWLYVRTPSGKVGWVSARFVTLDTPCSQIGAAADLTPETAPGLASADTPTPTGIPIDALTLVPADTPTSTPVVKFTATAPSATYSPAVGWVYVAAGEFIMGSSDDGIRTAVEECNASEGNCQADWFAGEGPQRVVYVNAFSLARYETTNEQYAACVAAGVCSPAGRAVSDGSIAYDPAFFAAQRPVVAVNWDDAARFCAWIGGRLPTEVEWEKAARGLDARRYPWGNGYEAGRANLASGSPAAVGSYPGGASYYGIQDMAGNAFEWTSTPADGRYVLRGGGWDSFPFRGRVTDRGTKLPPAFANYDIGFRCARDER